MTKDNAADVVRYYNKTESRVGYDLFLRGTKHFGFYRPGDSAWNWQPALRRMEDRLAQELALPAGAWALDAGCGVADVASRLASVHGLRITGIDILDFNVQEARKRIKRRQLDSQVSVCSMSYSELKFPDEAFDGVYTLETLVHAADAETVLAEFYRVLRPGGHLALFEYSRDPEENMSSRAAEAFRFVNEHAAMPSFQRFEHGVLERLLEKVGFRSITVEDISANILPMVRCFSIIGAIPYWGARFLDRPEKAVNAMSAVEFWRYRQHFRYNIYTARK